MAQNENAVVETTENEGKVGFFKKHGKKIAIGLGALGAVGLGYALGKLSGKRNANACDSEDYSSESDESVD